MEKLDLNKLKMASSSLTERIITNGTQMGRTISSKMKEILQTPTPESRIVDEATSESLSEPNWGLNLRICSSIGRGEYDGTEIVKAIKRKLVLGKNPVVMSLSLDLLETCCDKVSSEVASEKVLDDMVKLIEDERSEHVNRVRALQLIRAWGESEELAYLPVFRQMYMQLKSRETPVGQDQNRESTQRSLESYLDQQPLPPPESYPVPNAGVQNHVQDDTFVVYDLQSGEEKKERLVVIRNSIDILSSILNSEAEPKPLEDELTVSMLEKCKHSLPVLQRIIQNTSDDEVLLFDALNLHDELQVIISKYEELTSSPESAEPKSHNTEELPGNSSTAEATLAPENSKTAEPSGDSNIHGRIHSKAEVEDIPKVSSTESSKTSHAEEAAADKELKSASMNA